MSPCVPASCCWERPHRSRCTATAGTAASHACALRARVNGVPPRQAASYVPPKLVARLVGALFHRPFCHGFPALSGALVEYIRHADHAAHAELAHAHAVIESIEQWRLASVKLLERGDGNRAERPFDQELEALGASLAGLEYVQVRPAHPSCVHLPSAARSGSARR